MTTRDEMEQAIDDVIHEASSLGALKSSIWGPSAVAIVQDRVDAARVRLLALRSPARPDGDVTLVLSREDADTIYTALCCGIDECAIDEQDGQRLIDLINAALDAAAHDRPGGTEATA
jgi:hypothetical protein